MGNNNAETDYIKNDYMKKARGMIEMMAKGANPVTGLPAEPSDCINDPEVIKGLCYVLGVLDAAAGGRLFGEGSEPGPAKRDRKSRSAGKAAQGFSVSSEQLARFPYSDYPMVLTAIVKHINEIAQCNQRRIHKLTYPVLAKMLTDDGLIIEDYSINGSGKLSRKPTQLGSEWGIELAIRSYNDREYQVLTFDINAQKYITDRVAVLFPMPEIPHQD